MRSELILKGLGNFPELLKSLPPLNLKRVYVEPLISKLTTVIYNFTTDVKRYLLCFTASYRLGDLYT